jgi:hypothetical protein
MQLGYKNVVRALFNFDNLKSDLKSRDGRSPISVAANPEIKEVFREARAHRDRMREMSDEHKATYGGVDPWAEPDRREYQLH